MTPIYYSALFDQDNQIIYILQGTVLEAVDKRINIFTVDLKTGKIYNFDDYLPFFATYYLYNNQLFATGRGESGTRETYIINKDTVEKYTGKLDVEFYSIGSYHDVPINHWELNIMFLDVTALNADPTKHDKLIDVRTNQVYSSKCGLMYMRYFWAKNFANVVGNCEIDYEPFGEFGLDWDAFRYGIRGTAKIYSGCDTKTKTILSIDAFCQDVRE